MTNTRFKSEWIYLTLSSDGSSELNAVMSEHQYVTIAGAVADLPPSTLPTEIRDIGVFIGRVILQKNDVTLIQTDSAFTQQFTPSGASDHNALANLQGGQLNEYYHLNASIYTNVISYMTNFTASVQSIMASTISSIQTSINNLSAGMSGINATISNNAANWNNTYNASYNTLLTNAPNTTLNNNLVEWNSTYNATYAALPNQTQMNTKINKSGDTMSGVLNTSTYGITMLSSNYSSDIQISNGTRPYQISINISNAVGVNTVTNIFTNGHANANLSDIRFYLDNTTLLPYWIENTTTGRTWINVTSNGTINMKYGNPGMLSLSNGTTTFKQWHGIASDSFQDALIKNNPLVYEALARRSDIGQFPFGVSDIQNTESAASGNYSVIDEQFTLSNDGINGNTANALSPYWTQDVYYRIKIVIRPENVTFYPYGDLSTPIIHTVNIPNPNALMGLNAYKYSGTGDQQWSFIREYSFPEPVFSSTGIEQTAIKTWCMKVDSFGVLYTSTGGC